MADAQVGKLFVKIVPDAEDFQRKTKRLAEAQGRAMEKALSGSSRRAAASAGDAVEDQIERVDKAAEKSSRRVSSALKQARERDARESRAAAAQAANVAAVAAERASRANAAQLSRLREQEYRNLFDQTEYGQRIRSQALARYERDAAASAMRQANVAAIAQERAARANAATLARLREKEYAELFDQIETEDRLRTRAAKRASESSIARGFRLQQEQMAADALRQVTKVDREVSRIESRGGWTRRLMGTTGRAGRDVEGPIQRAAKSFAFIGGGPLRGVASTLGLVGGKAAVAGGAVAVLGSALVAAGVAAVGIGAGTYAYAKFATTALQSAGALEQQRAAFTTMLKSGEEGEAMLRKVAKFAVETPFSTDDVATGAKRLMAYGFAAEDVIPVLTDLGDAAGALGLDGGGLNRLITAFGQVRTTGKLQGDEARQLAENGIPVWEMLAKKMGKSTQEVRELTSKGLVPAELAIEALREGIQESFGGGMQAQVNTFTGTMEKLRESVSTGLGMSLLPSLPAISSEMSKIGDSLLIATTALGTGLGQSLATTFRAAQPAISEFATSMSGAIRQIMGEWTPTMTALTTSLASAFSGATPAIGAFSSVFSGIVSQIAQSMGGLVDGVNKVAQSFETVFQIPGIDVLLFDLGRIGMALEFAGETIDFLAGQFAAAMSTVLGHTSMATKALAAMFDALSKVPGMGWAEGAANALEGVAGGLARVSAEAAGVAERSQLSVEVRADITTAESALSGIAAAVNTLNPEVKVKYGVDPAGIAQFNSKAINDLLGLQPEVLAKVGIDKTTLNNEINAIRGVLDPLSDPVKTTINADASGALAAAAAAQQALDNPSLADKLLKISGDPSGVISAANSASVILSAIRQSQPVLVDASTSPLEAKAAAAKAILDAVEQYQPAPIDASPAQTALAAQQAQQLIDAVRQNAPILLSADASPTATEALAAQALLEAVGQGAPAPIDADPTPAVAAAAEASNAVKDVQQGDPPPIDANVEPVKKSTTVAQSFIDSMNGKTVPITARDNATPVVRGIIGQLDAIPRNVNVTVNVGTRETGSRAGVPITQRAVPYPSGGGEVGVNNVSPMSRQGASSVFAMSVPKQAGAWQIPLSQMLEQLRSYYTKAASVIREGLDDIYATEYRYYRYLEVVRSNFNRQQEDALELTRKHLAARTIGLEGDALSRQEAANEEHLRQFQRRMEDDRRQFEWSLEDRRMYYDEQRRLADALVQQMSEMQDRLRGTVSWDQFLSPSSLIRNLDRNTAILTKYTDNLAKLRAQGLSKEAQTALSEMDPISAAKLAERLLSDPNAIAELNRAYGAFISAGIKNSAAYITPQQVGGTTFAPPPIATSARTAVAGQGVVVDMTVMPSQPVNERQLASAIGSELMWRIA